MATHPVYDRLLEGITEPMEKKVMEILLERAGDPVTRYELLEAVHGKKARLWAEKHGLQNSAEDRQNRKIVERLQRLEYPITSSSGSAGYVLAADEEDTDSYIAELITRRTNLDEKIASLRKSKRWIKFVRDWKAGRPATQLPLMGA